MVEGDSVRRQSIEITWTNPFESQQDQADKTLENFFFYLTLLYGLLNELMIHAECGAENSGIKQIEKDTGLGVQVLLILYLQIRH